MRNLPLTLLLSRTVKTQNREPCEDKIYKFHLQYDMYFKKTGEGSKQAKEFLKQVNCKKCLNMHNCHEYAFNQCNEKVCKKIVLN